MRKNNLDAKNEMSQMVELPDKDFKKLSNNCFNSQLRILLEHMEIQKISANKYGMKK